MLRGRHIERGRRGRLVLCATALVLLGAGGAYALQNNEVGQLNVAVFTVPHCEGYAFRPPPPEQLPAFCLVNPKRLRITIRSLPSREVVGEVVTQRDGLGRVYLRPGEYELRPQRRHRTHGRYEARRVNVVPDGPTDVIFYSLPRGETRRAHGTGN